MPDPPNPKKVLPVGTIGYAVDAIAEGKKGFCHFAGERYDIKAGAAIRKWAEVIVISNAPEPLAIETWGVFPLSYLLSNGDFTTVGEDHPMPVGGVSKPKSVRATASGDTELVGPDAEGEKVVVTGLYIFNSGASSITVYLKFTGDTEQHYKGNLAAQTGINVNLVDGNWEGDANDKLYINLGADGTVDVTVRYRSV